MAETTIDDAVMPGKPSRWALLAGVWLIYFAFGMVSSSFAPVVSLIQDDLGIGDARMGFILGSWPLGYVFAALPVGILLDRIGPRTGLLIASGLVALSALGRAMADGPVEMLASVAILGVGGPMISVGAPQLISTLFEGRDRGTAMGVYITGPALGAVVAIGATNTILMPILDDSWRAAMILHSVLAICAGAAWLIVSRNLPRLRMTSNLAKPRSRIFLELLASARVRAVLYLAVGIFFINHALNNWLPQLLEWHGYGASQAGLMASIPNVVGLVVAVIVPRFVPVHRRMRALAALVLCSLLAALLLQTDATAMLITGLVVQGFSRGAMMTFAMLILLDLPEISRDTVGLVGGMFFTIAQIGGFVGPLTFGILLDVTGGFMAPLIALSTICVFMLGVLSTARDDMSRHRESDRDVIIKNGS